MKQRVIERHMFYGAKKNIFLKAIELRRNMTEAEEKLWQKLKDRNIFEARWKRQHPIDIFIADFYCHRYKIIVEVDGEIHMDSDVAQRDDGRTYELENMGITILRFTNKEIFENIEAVTEAIKRAESSKKGPSKSTIFSPQTP